ncbi:MAG: DNA cytosine methyltransferase [Chloroflexi bacterium]|nr:DNA cytosine methyltransferase [Chloroflexota bacterium]
MKVVDFFSGCGGTSCGLKAAGLTILAGIDNDPDAAMTYQANFPRAAFWADDIRAIPTTALEPLLSATSREPLLFSACAPCQPYSRQRGGSPSPSDERLSLLLELTRFLRHYQPEFVFLENVPGLKHSVSSGAYRAFTTELTALGYDYEAQEIECGRYGVPQVRTRLVLIGSRIGPVHFPRPTHGPNAFATVRDWIGPYEPLAAGETHPTIPNHRAAALSDLNLTRIRATREGGSWRDWPKALLPDCHRDFAGFSDVYGRLRWDRPSPALTTRCISYSNGRYGHPDQDRALSVREAAALQTFPMDFVFHGSLNSTARQVGNAVPVLLAQRFGEAFAAHVAPEPVRNAS